MQAAAVAVTNADGYAGSAAHICSATTPAAKHARNGMMDERIGGRAAPIGNRDDQRHYKARIDTAILRSADCDGRKWGAQRFAYSTSCVQRNNAIVF
jgi:hypothetical protein